MIGVVEGLLYASKMNLDLHQVVETTMKGFANSVYLTTFGHRIVDRDLNPVCYAEHFGKDMAISLEEAEKVDLQLPNLSIMKKFYEELKVEGDGRLGTQVLIRALERMNKY